MSHWLVAVILPIICPGYMLEPILNFLILEWKMFVFKSHLLALYCQANLNLPSKLHTKTTPKKIGVQLATMHYNATTFHPPGVFQSRVARLRGTTPGQGGGGSNSLVAWRASMMQGEI